jgi:photosystem II stability/assembly factor-like uncharacterized protein
MLKNRIAGIVGLGFALFLLVGLTAYTATADTPPAVQDPVPPDRSQPEVRDPGYSDTYMQLLSISGQEFTKGGRTFFSDAVAAPSAVQSQPSSLSWTPVRRVTVDPNDSQTLYAAIDNLYGIYRSRDGGTYWEGVFTGCDGHTLVFANDDTTALATLGYFTGSYHANCAVLRSDDGGHWWFNVSSGITRTVVAAAFDPTNAMHIYAATLGAGIYQTTNGGTTWVQTNTGLADDYIFSIAVCPSNSNILYAGGLLWAYRSDDGGNTWYIADNNYPCLYTEGIAIRPSDCNTFYTGGRRLAGPDPDGLTLGGFFKSTAGAGDGNLVLKNSGMQDTFVLDIAQDPLDPDILYAGTWASGVFRSDDGGVTWQPKNAGFTNPYVYSIAATQGPVGTVLYAGTFYVDGGLYKSTDRGESWTEVSEGSDLYPVVFDAITTGSADNLAAATSRGAYWSSDGGQTWSPSTGLAGGQHGIVLRLASRPTNPSRLLAATYGGGIYASADAGHSWVQVEGYYGSEYVFDLGFRPASGTEVYAATWGIQHSSDAGLTWSSLGALPDPDWVRAVDARTGTHPDVFAGTYVKGVYMSPDGNGTWAAINSGLSDLRIRSLKATTADTLFAGTNGSSGWQYSMLTRSSVLDGQDEPAGVQGTNTWTKQGPYIPAPSVIQIAIDPSNTNRIYAATDQGVYRSTNGGETWVPKNQGLGGYGDLVDSGIAIDPNNPSTLYLATWGYGIFKSTDLGDHWVRLSDPLKSTQVYLPMMLRDVGTPPPPTLYSISNPDGDGNYTVSWSTSSSATSYTLQEDNNAAFSSPATVYSGPGTSKSFSGKSTGTYYYRVNGVNQYGAGEWSNTRSVTVAPELPTKLYPNADATVIEGAAGYNFGSTSDMWVGYDHCEPAARARSLVKFDTSAIPPGTSISQARLSIYLVNCCDIGERTHRVIAYNVTGNWSESSVTWNSKPGYGAEYGSVWVPSRTWGRYQIDVTSLVRGWVNGTITNRGLMLRSNESSGTDSARLGFGTREASGTTYDPYLTITYTGLAGEEETTLPAIGSPESTSFGPTIHDILSGLLSTPDTPPAGYTEQSVYVPE